ncbi:bifunctional DNA primase/helicase [Rickettsiella massiliensis]|uniref:bifunctional DNA primase/helicase n=1 Tax=Rickettsiella massiliensis TaxID=676517 RepID=UPI001F463F41|nr:toprim domain-containing protein [Rickettsiella massiliensis]
MAKEIAPLLAQQVESIAAYLLPNGKREGSEWRVGSINGEPGKSLAVHLGGNKAGIWCDFAEGTQTGGDLLDLWAGVRKISLFEAMKEAERYLGLSSMQFEPYKPKKFTRPNIHLKSLTKNKVDSPVKKYLIEERKLTEKTIEDFKIKEKGRNIVFPYWRDNEIVFVKYLSIDRVNGKKQISVEKDCEPCLFGWHLIPNNARSVTLCEGEIDAMTLHQYGIAVLSVPFGGGTGNKHRWLDYEFDRLSVFDKIYLCFDNDEEGKSAATDLIARLGAHRCRLVNLPHKDANACLQAEMTPLTMRSLFNESKTLDPQELKQASSFVDEVINEFYPPDNQPLGIYPPWQKAKDKILFRQEELSIWTGTNGHGKSQFLGHIILSAMKQDARVCIASLELKPKRLLYRLTRQAAGLEKPTEGYIRAIHEWYDDRLLIFDLLGTAKADRLLEVFLYAWKRYRINMFVIDSFLKLDISEDDYTAQKRFIEKLCDFKNQYPCHIHLVVHPRKNADEHYQPGKLDNKGTGAISDLADNCFTVWRNKKKEDLKRRQEQGYALSPKDMEELKSNDCIWSCDKQRNGDWEGKIGLSFDRNSFQYLGSPDHKPTQFVDYSCPVEKILLPIVNKN